MTSYFVKVAKYYDEGRWTKRQVAAAVVKGWITAIEYGVIVGEEYIPQ